MITLGEIKTTVSNHNYRIEIPVSFGKISRVCWYEIPEQYKDMTAVDRADSFVVSLLLPAMLCGENIHSETPISEKLLYHLNEELIPTIAAFNGKDWKGIEVISDSVLSNQFHGQYVGTGFSGGIDSFSTIYTGFEKQKDPRFRISHLFFFNVGAHGMIHSDADELRIRNKFWARYHALKPFADECHLPFVPVDSNVHSFMEGIGHLESCSLVTPAAAMLFQKSIHLYLLSSSGYSYKDNLNLVKNFKTGTDLCYLDPWIIPFLSSESMEIKLYEPRKTRIEKTAQIVDYEPVQRYLNVCGNQQTIDTNCSICEKCCRTLLLLDLIGKIHVVSNRFDIPKYHNQGEKKFVARLFAMRKKKPFYEAMIQLAENRGIDLSQRTNLHERILFHFTDSPLHNFLRKINWLHKLVKRIKK